MRLFKVILGLFFTLPLSCLSNSLTQDHACLKEYQLNNFDKAMAICLPGAKLNNPEAQYVIGMLYKRGKGIERSQEKAMQWLTLSADQGYAAAQLKLGKMLSASILPDYAKAFDYFLNSANQNNFEAQFLVALCYQNGLGVSKNTNLALWWYNKAIVNGLDAPIIDKVESVNKISTKKTPQTPDKFAAMKIAADRNDANAQFEVAKYYLHGQVTEQDDVMALNYFKASAAQHNKQAKGYLAWMNILGLGAPQNLQEAIYWFTSCYDNGLMRKPVSILPAVSEQEAKDQAKKFYDEALKLLQDSDSENQKQGITLLTHAANRNYVEAQVMLAKFYQTGKWVKQNSTEAALWFEKAAQQDNSEAQYALGWLYFNGEGLPKDVSLSSYWFNKAALHGNAPAKSAKNFVQTYLSSYEKPSKNLLQVYNDVIQEQKSQKIVNSPLKPFSKPQHKNKDRLATR